MRSGTPNRSRLKAEQHSSPACDAIARANHMPVSDTNLVHEHERTVCAWRTKSPTDATLKCEPAFI
jgi:hypothetical protein